VIEVTTHHNVAILEAGDGYKSGEKGWIVRGDVSVYVDVDH
jgi:hypothetical protein